MYPFIYGVFVHRYAFINYVVLLYNGIVGCSSYISEMDMSRRGKVEDIHKITKDILSNESITEVLQEDIGMVFQRRIFY